MIFEMVPFKFVIKSFATAKEKKLMSDAKKDGIEGHYNYYGIPAYILKQKNGAYASGFFDANEAVFKAGGSAGRKVPACRHRHIQLHQLGCLQDVCSDAI